MFGILGKAAKAGIGLGKKVGLGSAKMGMKAGIGAAKMAHKASKPTSMIGPTRGAAQALIGKKKKPGVV